MDAGMPSLFSKVKLSDLATDNSDTAENDSPNGSDSEKTGPQDRAKEKKKRHERERKARRSAEKAAQREQDRNEPVPQWVEEARDQAFEDMRSESPGIGCKMRIFPGYTMPGIAMFVVRAVSKLRGLDPGQAEILIKHAVTFGLKDEAKLLRGADDGYIDDLHRYSRKHSPLAKVPPQAEASELAIFRRVWPIGTSTASWRMDVTYDKKHGLTINFHNTPFAAIDGSVEESIFTALALPTHYAPTVHVTLPMLRKALHDISHGSTEHLVPTAGGTYATVTHYMMTNEIEPARWLKAKAQRLNDD